MNLIKSSRYAAVLFITILLICNLLYACASQTPIMDETMESAVPEIPAAETLSETEEKAAETESSPTSEEERPLYDTKLLVAFYPGIDPVYENAILNAIESEFALAAVKAYLPATEPCMDMREGIDACTQFLPQYSAIELIDDVRWAYELSEDYVGTLAITACDLYSGDPGNDFVYAKKSGNVGIISIARFITDGSGPEVFTSRIVKQTLSTVSSILKRK